MLSLNEAAIQDADFETDPCAFSPHCSAPSGHRMYQGGWMLQLWFPDLIQLSSTVP